MNTTEITHEEVANVHLILSIKISLKKVALSESVCGYTVVYETRDPLIAELLMR